MTKKFVVFQMIVAPLVVVIAIGLAIVVFFELFHPDVWRFEGFYNVYSLFEIYVR